VDSTTRWRIWALLVALALLAVACGGDSASLVRYDIPDTTISIEHPEGWLTASEGGATLLAETEDAFRGSFEQDPPPLSDLTIVFDHRELTFMRSIGLGEDASPRDLMLFNVQNFGWSVISDTRSVEVFGDEAIAARVSTGIGVSEVIQGFLPGGEEIFLLQVSGPNEAALDAFASTWDDIVAGVTATG